MKKDTSVKGDIGVLAVIKLAIINGINVSIPFGDRLPYDLVFEKDGILKRVQVKYRKANTKGVMQIGTHNKYNEKNIDTFAVYCPQYNKVSFLDISEVGSSSNFNIRFMPSKVNYKRIRYAEVYSNPLRVFDKLIKNDIEIKKRERVDRFEYRKVVRPSKEELEKMVWQHPTSMIAKQFGITDSAIGKWCKDYKISKPPRGYWNKKKAGLI